jgi:hypothetical protein
MIKSNKKIEEEENLVHTTIFVKAKSWNELKIRAINENLPVYVLLDKLIDNYLSGKIKLKS